MSCIVKVVLGGTGGTWRTQAADGATTPLPFDSLSAVVQEIRSSLSADTVSHIELSVSPEEELRSPASVGLVGIGMVRRPFEALPIAAKLSVAGTIDIEGTPTAPLDEHALRAALPELVDRHRLRGLAVSGTNSNRNPVHEMQAACVMREVSGLPVIEGRYWGNDLDVRRRAMSAFQGLAQALRLRDATHAFLSGEAGDAIPPVRVRLSPELLAAISACAELDELARLAGGDAVPPARARITRSPSGYACQCIDGCFEFESITAARTFAEEHLRRLMANRAERMHQALHGVCVEAQERYTYVKGRRGPVRVYLETLIVARAK